MPLFLLGFSAGLCALAFQGRPWGAVLLWPAWNALLLAAFYAFNFPRGFGKRADGRMPAWPWWVHGPFLVFLHSVWWIQVRFFHFGEPVAQEVAPGLWIARRLRSGEVPEIFRGGGRIVDLTAEFREPEPIAQSAGWRWIPVLDAGVPDAAARRGLEDLAAECLASPAPVLVHCAQGHGRSAMVAAWLLVRTGRVESVASALAQIQAVRPGARAKRNQRKWLEREFSASSVPATA